MPGHGGIDEKAFARLIRRLVDARVDSIGALGSTGSYAYLTRPERARVAHRVEVRAEHEAGKSRAAALVAADRVADRVEPGLHSRLAHPAENPLAGGAPLGRKEHSRQPSRKLGMPRQRIAALHDARGINPQFAHFRPSVH
jgi:hypothetical protein